MRDPLERTTVRDFAKQLFPVADAKKLDDIEQQIYNFLSTKMKRITDTIRRRIEHAKNVNASQTELMMKYKTGAIEYMEIIEIFVQAEISHILNGDPS